MSELTAEERKRARWRGKAYERRVAKLIKGKVVGRSKAVIIEDERGGVTAIRINCQQPPDVVNVWLSVECKHPRQVPVWLDKLMTQAVRNAPQDLTPVGWVGDREAKTNYVIMTERDFLDLHIGG